MPRGVVLADAAYGTEAAWRDQLTTWGLHYAVEVEHTRVLRRASTGTDATGQSLWWPASNPSSD
jgi:SRSO17 transposase